MSTINTANINFKWDPKSLEIRTLAVERLLEPLVTQVMYASYIMQYKKKKKSPLCFESRRKHICKVISLELLNKSWVILNQS